MPRPRRGQPRFVGAGRPLDGPPPSRLEAARAAGPHSRGHPLPPSRRAPTRPLFPLSPPPRQIFKNGSKQETIIGAVPKTTLVQSIERFL